MRRGNRQYCYCNCNSHDGQQRAQKMADCFFNARLFVSVNGCCSVLNLKCAPQIPSCKQLSWVRSGNSTQFHHKNRLSVSAPAWWCKTLGISWLPWVTDRNGKVMVCRYRDIKWHFHKHKWTQSLPGHSLSAKIVWNVGVCNFSSLYLEICGSSSAGQTFWSSQLGCPFYWEKGW